MGRFSELLEKKISGDITQLELEIECAMLTYNSYFEKPEKDKRPLETLHWMYGILKDFPEYNEKIKNEMQKIKTAEQLDMKVKYNYRIDIEG